MKQWSRPAPILPEGQTATGGAEESTPGGFPSPPLLPSVPTDDAPSELVAWARIEHRVRWIREQLQAVKATHESTGSGHSYIKTTALALAMRAVLAGLDALSELIPA